ncbi:predicted protein [Sclerotinia sclerotiorum 1980 UF-70]|uniref:MYND-type domain-containing protein n=2 Tax=Sclerotinia sclerotiorum (strain ATCC 18683 / 1980 / Ss-1) TaxID=665079 RepID=A7EBI5_SCLS1|nr:predicted protein [Sclerotinia sclerotiorum 1980 UF-70]APA08862.1 hypothetical protein sscle_04g036320 [Sclerotinia sclerotiorum 1980 UF-70]EDN99813.1 predicted protein [Sclerotinia sclerotiorum 1980 UF-70]
MIIRVTSHPTCSFCYGLASTKLLCGSCKSITYCSAKCQKLDWPLHKVLCKAFASLRPRPSERHKLILYFPVDSTYAKLGWFPCPEIPQAQGSDEETELLFRKQINFEGDTINSSFIISCAGHLDGGSKLNQSIISVPDGPDLHGPVIVFRKDRPGSPSIILDIALADFRVVIKLLKQLSSLPNNSRGNEAVKMNTKLTQGVLFAPSRKKSYDAASIPDYHPIYDKEPTSVTKQLGIPLIVEETTRGVDSDDQFDDDSLRTRICNALHIDIDPDSKTWGKTLPGWRRKIGHFLVARQDKRDITFDQLIDIVNLIDCLSYPMPNLLTRPAREQLLYDFSIRSIRFR